MSEDRLPEEPLTDEAFLARWSRRKQDAVQAHAQEQPSPESVGEPSAQLTDADMPPIESLDENADYRGFLSPKVSEALRQQALQKLFSSACFNVCDGLDDYAEDFTRFEKLGEIVTADLRHRLQREAKRAAERAQAEAGEATQQERPRTAQEETPAEDDEIDRVSIAGRRDGTEPMQDDSEEGLS